MSKPDRIPQDARADDDPDVQAAPSERNQMTCPASPPFDWQVLLLRYLPQPVGSTHVIKRLAPR